MPCFLAGLGTEPGLSAIQIFIVSGNHLLTDLEITTSFPVISELSVIVRGLAESYQLPCLFSRFAVSVVFDVFSERGVISHGHLWVILKAETISFSRTKTSSFSEFRWAVFSLHVIVCSRLWSFTLL
jgi:hypothetical protein